MPELRLRIIDETFSVHRLEPDSKVPQSVYLANLYSISKTQNELSIVCPSYIAINSDKVEDGWSCLEVLGPLEFSMTGVLAGISSCLAEAGISIFAISTYDTDYILLKATNLQKATTSLVSSGYSVTPALPK